MANAIVQTHSNTASSTSVAVAMGNTTTGNCNIVVIGNSGISIAVSSVTDSQSNTYVKASGGTNANGSCEIWYAKNITGGTTPTVTVTMGSSTGVGVIVREYSGLDTTAPFDKGVGAAGSGGTPSSGNTATTTQANELVIGGILLEVNTPTAGSGYGNLATCLPAACAVGMEDKTVAATAAYSATFGNASVFNWYCAAATFKETTGSPSASLSPSISPSASRSPSSSLSASVSPSASISPSSSASQSPSSSMSPSSSVSLSVSPSSSTSSSLSPSTSDSPSLSSSASPSSSSSPSPSPAFEPPVDDITAMQQDDSIDVVQVAPVGVTARVQEDAVGATEEPPVEIIIVD